MHALGPGRSADADAAAKTLLSLSIPITISSSVARHYRPDRRRAHFRAACKARRCIWRRDEAMQTYGICTGVINFFNLPQTLITALAVSVLPTIAERPRGGQ
ncbi:MAG: hypothetical protein ACLR4Z_01730 [Butyricicoccaceae bacterium]